MAIVSLNQKFGRNILRVKIEISTKLHRMMFQFHSTPCLIALTPDAKALGFKMGDVFFQNEWKLKKHGVAYFSSNYTLYGDVSRRVMTAMYSIVPEVDQYSIDEAFIPFDEVLAAQPLDVGWALHCTIGRRAAIRKMWNWRLTKPKPRKC